MKPELVFEKIGDVTTPYPYLYVYLTKGEEPRLPGGALFLARMQPFMGIFITEAKTLEIFSFSQYG